ncbi:hypothetical protein GIB67_006016 [Kingdonia uniflora]|uniref:Golgin candidate 6 n=1 Tax=Kingdonia uniflora TaxID=39325 RepID=A0A7J7MC10_9MAGN|nr:hypothetical protein GIB67_006016 [Kingdonia uniflora]
MAKLLLEAGLRMGDTVTDNLEYGNGTIKTREHQEAIVSMGTIKRLPMETIQEEVMHTINKVQDSPEARRVCHCWGICPEFINKVTKWYEWIPPEPGTLKLNCYGKVSVQRGITIATQNGFRKVVIATSNKDMAGHIEDTSKADWECNFTYSAIGVLTRGLDECKIVYEAKECNRALRCIGDLVAGHPQNLDALASKALGEQPQVEPALNSILRIILRTSSAQEFIAADYVFKCFCENNADGQAILASTIIPHPHSMTHAPQEEDINMSFGSMLLHGLSMNDTDGDLETCSRAASVLYHILKGNIQCKEKVLQVELEQPMASLGAPEPLMHRIVKYLAIATSKKTKDINHKSSTSTGDSYIQPIILRLLVTWLADSPNAVHSFLDSRPHLTYLLELVSSPSETVCVSGLSAVLLGECVLYNKSGEDSKNSFMVVDAISQKIGLTSYFLKFDEMQKSFLFVSAKPSLNRKPLERSNAASAIEDLEENNGSDQPKDVDPVLMSLFDIQFVSFVKSLEADIRESVVEVFSHTKNDVAVVPAELEMKSGETNEDYIKRLKSFVEKQCREMQDLLGRNSTLAEELSKTGGASDSGSDQRTSGGRERVQTENLRRDLQEAVLRVEMLKSEKAKIEAEASSYRNLAGKIESDLKSLSNAYNSLEQSNFQLETELKSLGNGGERETHLDLEAIKAQAREESEAELNDLLVCLGQEQSRVEKLSARLAELGEDVDALLEGVGDDIGLADDDQDDDED